jgi:hypothetical protein
MREILYIFHYVELFTIFYISGDKCEQDLKFTSIMPEIIAKTTIEVTMIT